MRRLGLQLVGRTMEAAKLLPAKQAFRILDPDGKGYITEDDLVEVWETLLSRFFFSSFFCGDGDAIILPWYEIVSKTVFFLWRQDLFWP